MGRKDARFLKELKPASKFYTFLMPRRTTSSVWIQLSASADNMLQMIGVSKQSGRRYTVFHVIIAALLRTASQHPQLNRFVYGHKIYARNDYAMSFAVTAGDTTVYRKVRFEPDETLQQVSEKILGVVENARAHIADHIDDSIDTFMKLPDWLSELILLRMYPWMVDKGIFPRRYVDEDILYSSAIISNLGSFNLEAPYHHLYEWGNTSVFVTVGAIEKKPVVMPDDSIKPLPCITIGFTVDERICDGKVLADALKLFKSLIENPSLLETPPGVVIRE